MACGPAVLRRGSLALWLAFGACAGPRGDITVRVPPYAPTGAASLLSAAPKTSVAVAPFAQTLGTGDLPGRIGERKTVADISLGMVTIDPTPGTLVGNALAAELRAAGHTVSSDRADATLTGRIRRFVLRTDATAVYWDVAVDAEATATLAKGGNSVIGTYGAHCSQRTYVWPGPELIAQVVATCVADLAHAFRDDPHVGQLLATP